jgi:glycosyltransferase involved in cell wall biosynthesis
MKIGLISQPWESGGPPDPGGSIGLLTWELARRLARSCEVVVCGPRSGPTARETSEGVEFLRFGLRLDRWLLDRPRGLMGPLDASRKDVASILYCTIYAMRCARALSEAGCDIVHIHNFSQFVPIARLFHRKAKIVLHMNCDWLVQFDWKLTNSRLRHADAIIGCAEYITNHIKERFPNYAARCSTLYNGADVNEFSRPEQALERGNGKRFIFVGRVSPEKGIHVLLQAFANVLAHEPDAELKIIGGAYVPPLSFIVEQSNDPMVLSLRPFYVSGYMEYLLEQARTIAGKKVSFVGFVPHRELATHLGAADVFVQPSVWGEPFPLSVVEAMAAGLPVVSSRTGGLSESVVHEKTGLLVERNDPTALANAMLRLICDRNLACRMGMEGAARAQEMFSWDAVVTHLSALYRAMISKHQ